jgi:hypothetical protein
MQNTGEVALSGAKWMFGIWRCPYSNSERTQQYGANEREHGEHRQHIEPQGKVHVSSPCC